jgi:hypothetical protein
MLGAAVTADGVHNLVGAVARPQRETGFGRVKLVSAYLNDKAVTALNYLKHQICLASIVAHEHDVPETIRVGAADDVAFVKNRTDDETLVGGTGLNRAASCEVFTPPPPDSPPCGRRSMPSWLLR